MDAEALRVLLLDDEDSLRLPLSEFLHNEYGYEVCGVSNGQDALQQAAQAHFDVALIDQYLISGPDGITVMQELKSRYANLECIILTGWGQKDRQRALSEGAFRYIEKPFDNDELALLIRTAAQQVRLRSIGADILSKQNLDQILTSILNAARSLALADDSALALLDENGRLDIHSGAPASTAPRWRRHFSGLKISQKIIETGRPLTYPSFDVMPGPSEGLRQAGYQSLAGVAVPGLNGHRLGVLYVYSQRSGHFDAWGTLTVLQTLASQAGLAIENARNFEQISTHASFMDALVHSGQGLTQARREEDALALCAEFLRHQFSVTTFFVALYDPERKTLRFPVACDGERKLEIADIPLEAAPERWGASGYVFKTGREVSWFTREQGVEFCRSNGIFPIDVEELEVTQTCFYLPLQSASQTFGIISIQSKRPRAFSPILLDAFRTFANQLATALENLRLFEVEARLRQEAENLRSAALNLIAPQRQANLFENILIELQKVVPFDSASVQILDNNSSRIIGGYGFPNLSQVLGATFDLDSACPNQQVFLGQGAYIVPDVRPIYPAFSTQPHVQADIHSWLGVPMLVGEQMTGMLTLDKQEIDFYTAVHARLAQAFGNQAALLIANAELHRLTEQRAARLEGLQNLALSLNRSLDLPENLQAACRWAVSLFEVDHSGLVLFNDDCSQGVVAAEYPDLGTQGTFIPVQGVPVEEALITQKKPLSFEDVSHNDILGPVKEILQGFGINAIILVPVLDNTGQVIGSFSLDLLDRARTFLPDEIALCQVFAAHVAVAVHNVRLIQENQEGRAYLESLYAAGSAIISPTDPEQVLQAVVDNARQATGAWRVAALLVDGDVNAPPRFLAHCGYASDSSQARDAVRAHGISRQVVDDQQARFYPDFSQTQDALNPSMIEQGSRAAACVPLLIGERAIGVLWIQYRQPHPFSIAERHALRLFANQAAVAYDHAQLYADAHRRSLLLAALDQASRYVQSIKDPLKLQVEIARQATQLLSCDAGCLLAFQPHREEKDELLVAAAYNLPGWQAGLTPRHCKRLVWSAAHQGELVSCLAVGCDECAVCDYAQCVVTPLKLGGVTRFILLLLNSAPAQDVLTPAKLEILERFIFQAEIALQTSELIAREQRMVASVTRVRDGAQKVAQATTLGDLQSTLKSIIQAVRLLLNCDLVTLYTYNEQTDRLEHLVFDGEVRDAGHLKQPQEVLLRASSIRRLLAFGPPYYLAAPNSAEDPTVQGEFVKREGILSTLAFLLRFEGTKVGVLFTNYRTFHDFSQEETSNALLFANQAAVAIRNTQLYEEARSRASTLQALYEAGQIVTSSLTTLQETLERIAQQALALVGGRPEEGCIGYLSLKHGSLLEFTAASDPVTQQRLKEQVGQIDLERSPNIGITGRVALTGKGENVGFILNDPDYIEVDRYTLSQMAVPITMNDEIIGVISIEDRQEDAFSEDDFQALKHLASQAAIAIHNARQYEQLERNRVTYAARTQLAWVGMVSGAWRHSIEKHALTIRERTDLVRTALQKDNSITDKVADHLNVISEVASKILEKPITAPLGDEDHVRPIVINELVNDRVTQLWKSNPYRQLHKILELELDAGARVQAVPEWVGQALDILIDNAVDATAGQANRQVKIITRQRGAQAEILVQDNGPGLRPDVARRLLQGPIPKNEGEKGLGLGLLMAQMIVQAYGGDLRIVENMPHGLTVAIGLPLAAPPGAAAGSYAQQGETLVLLGGQADAAFSILLSQVAVPFGRVKIVAENAPLPRDSRIIIVDAEGVNDAAGMVRRLVAEHPQAHLLVTSASRTWRRARDLFQAGVVDYIPKAIDRSDLQALLLEILQRKNPSSEDTRCPEAAESDSFPC